jgi:branched-chain amino acid transport system ATP-binding protein
MVSNMQPGIGKSALVVRQLGAWYQDIQVLHGVDLEAQSGKVSAVLGPNGAGKTTLLLAIAGGVTCHGEITLNGLSISDESPRSRFLSGLALVQPQRRTFQCLTVEQNLKLVARNIDRSKRASAIDSIVEDFPMLKPWLAKSASELSGGQQQIVGIAQALVLRPTVLMLDEPSTGLAPQAVESMVDVINRLKAEDLAIVLVEQVLDLALALADDITILSRGRVASHGPRSSYGEDAESRARFLGFSSEQDELNERQVRSTTDDERQSGSSARDD